MPTIAKDISIKKAWVDRTIDYTHHFSWLTEDTTRVYAEGDDLNDSAGRPWGLDEDEVRAFLREYAADSRDHGGDMQWVAHPNGGVAIYKAGSLSLITGSGSDDVYLSGLVEALDLTVTWSPQEVLDYPDEQLREWQRGHGGGGALGRVPGWRSSLIIHGGRAREEAHLLDRATYGVEVLRRFTRERGHESARLDWQPATT